MRSDETQPTPRRADATRQVVRALFQFRGTAVAFYVLFVGFLVLISYVFPPIYLGHALVLIKPGRESFPASFMPQSSAQSVAVTTTLEDVNSEISLMTGRPVMGVVADRLIAEQVAKPETTLTRFFAWCRKVGLQPALDPREDLLNTLQAKIEPEALPITHVIEVKYRNFDPELACRTVNHLLDAYVEQHSRIHGNPEALSFFAEQVKDFRRQLDEVQAKLTVFRAENDGGDLTLERSLLLTELTTVQSQRRALETIPPGSEDLASDAAPTNPTLTASRQRLLDLRIRLADQRLAFGDASKEVASLRSQIDVAQQDLTQQCKRLLEVLKKSESDLRANLDHVERQRATYNTLVDEETRLKGSLESYQKKYEEERVSKAMDADKLVSVRILERPPAPAPDPMTPWFPKRFLIAIVAVVLGVPGAIAAALLRAHLQGRVASVTDVEERLQVPVLATTPRVPWWRLWADPVEVASDGARIAFASLARRPGFGANGHGDVVHVVASSDHEGAAGFAAALARSASETRTGETALVTLGSRPESRRSENHTSVDELLARGKRWDATTPVTIFDLSQQSLGHVAELVAALRDRFATVVVAGTPIGGRSDGARHLRHGDCAILVVGAHRVHLEVARRSAELLRRESRELAGAVLTARAEPVPGLLYRWM